MKKNKITFVCLIATSIYLWPLLVFSEVIAIDKNPTLLIHAVSPGKHPADDGSPNRLSNAITNLLKEGKINTTSTISSFVESVSNKMSAYEQGPHITANNVNFSNSLCPDRTLYVLSIGINVYPNMATDLKHPVKEATNLGNEISSLCEDTKVKLLVDSAADESGVSSALSAIGTFLTKTDNVIVHYSGHGFYQTGDYMLYSDSSDDSLKESKEFLSAGFLSAESVFNRMRNAGLILLIVDASRSNPFNS